MNSKMFRILLTLLVSLPLGKGGLCCCLLQAPAASKVAHAAAPSCCHENDAPAESSTTNDSPGDTCSCPTRDTFLHESADPGAAAFAVSFVSFAPVAPLPDHSSVRLAAPFEHRNVGRPPKIPIHRKLCIALC